MSGDIETNPTIDDFVKIPLLQTYLITDKFDIACITESYLDSTYLDDDHRFNLDGFSRFRADHFFYKNISPLLETLVCPLSMIV